MHCLTAHLTAQRELMRPGDAFTMMKDKKVNREDAFETTTEINFRPSSALTIKNRKPPRLQFSLNLLLRGII